MPKGRYLTPEALSGAVLCRPLIIPVELLPYVSGALQELTFSYNWEAFGSASVEDVVSASEEMISTYFEGCESEGFGMGLLTNETSLEWFSWVVQTGAAITLSNQQVGAEVRALYRQSAAAINDKLRYSPWLAAGNYKFTVKAMTGPNAGQQHIQIGGTDYGVLDWYNGFGTLDVFQSCYFPVAADGVVNIDSVISSKNAASTAYNLFGERFWIEKQ